MPPETPAGGLHDDVKTTTIGRFASQEAAYLAAANLQAHGISCCIKADDAGGMLPVLAPQEGVRLLVREADAETALALLEEMVPDSDLPPETQTPSSTQSTETTTPGTRLAPFQTLLGVALGLVLCITYRGSTRLRTQTRNHYNREGQADETRIYRDGSLYELIRDRNNDGVPDSWTYYQNGRVVRVERDNNFDGIPDEFCTYTNDTLIRIERDTDFNGTLDEFCTVKDGMLQQIDFMPNGTKYVTQRQLFKNGVLVEILRGGDETGHFKESVRYDPFFNPISTNALP